jgi:hypothetical protein
MPRGMCRATSSEIPALISTTKIEGHRLQVASVSPASFLLALSASGTTCRLPPGGAGRSRRHAALTFRR